MSAVSDAFLLGLAEVLATLFGFVLVAMVKFVLFLYAVALGLTLGLVVLRPAWEAVLLAAGSAAGRL